MKSESKEAYFLIRQAVRFYINKYSENEKVYVYFYKDTDKIIYIEPRTLSKLIKENITIYETTLKNLYLYLFTHDYHNVDQAILVYLANKELKGYTNYDIQVLLSVNSMRLHRFENGYSDFKGTFSFKNLAGKLGFDEKEFNETFRKRFKRVDNER